MRKTIAAAVILAGLWSTVPASATHELDVVGIEAEDYLATAVVGAGLCRQESGEDVNLGVVCFQDLYAADFVRLAPVDAVLSDSMVAYLWLQLKGDGTCASGEPITEACASSGTGCGATGLVPINPNAVQIRIAMFDPADAAIFCGFEPRGVAGTMTATFWAYKLHE